MNHAIRSASRVIAPLLLGAGAAVLTTLAMRSAEPPARTPPPSSALRAGAAQGAAPRSADLASIERRLQGLEAARQRPTDEATTPPHEEPPPDMEEARRESRRVHEEQIQRHRASPIDHGWADQAESMLREDLGKPAEGRSFHLADIECRTSSCVATLEWPSYEMAPRDAPFIAANSRKMNCATWVWTPHPDDPAAPYRGEVVFDCSALRAGLVAQAAE